MTYGMTGTSENDAITRQLVPKGWNVLCPEATISIPQEEGFMVAKVRRYFASK